MSPALIEIAIALVWKDGRLLIARRPTGVHLAGLWEFPGGKIEPGEGREECRKRELVEEMGVQIEVGRPLTPATHDYAAFTVTLYPYVCSIASGEITLHEHSAISWLPAARMHELDWADADIPIIAEYQQSVTLPPV
jgi:8-oxo-dGTP diphosphatase